MESELNPEKALRYVPIILWALVTGIVSLLLGALLTRTFNMPEWVTPAIAFNNTTSLPLLLVQSLEATKLLHVLDPSGDVVERAKSYFLVNAMVGNCLTFALGPKLLNHHEDDLREQPDKDEDIDGQVEAQEHEAEEANEESSLLPNSVVRAQTRAVYSSYKRGARLWNRFPRWLRKSLNFLYQFVNAPVIGAAIGALIGLVPPLHRLFFNTQQEGGYFNAWLTSALQNVGDLFAAIQVVVVGVKLSTSLMRMRKGEENGKVPWMAFGVVTLIRFIIWPVISIAVIYLLVTRTSLISNDPILWFCMMLMPTGPSAMMLTALADVSGAGEGAKMSIAKFLTVSARNLAMSLLM